MSQKTQHLEKISRLLGYTFVEALLLESALTHRSFQASQSNERLEFLGDAVLSVIISKALFQQYPQASEGQLSRLRSSLVRRETLVEIAHYLQLGDYLYLGEGEIKSGGKQRDSILADALEAIIGAIYLDGGIFAAECCVLAWFKPKLAEIELNIETLKDPKSRLQEYLQAKKQLLPVYSVESMRDSTQMPLFKVTGSIPHTALSAVGTGSSRRRAEQAAAEALLKLIKHEK